MNDIVYQHEVIVPDRGLPFKLFLFEGGGGKYIREKHWHRSIEIFAVRQGQLDFFLNEKKYVLAAGDFVLVNSNEVHAIHAPLPNETIVLQIPLGVFADYYTEEQFIWFSHSGKEDDRQVFSLLETMFVAYGEKQTGYELKMLSCFYQLEYLLVTRYRKLEVGEEILKNNKQLKRLGRITGYLKEHYTEDLSLEKLAGIFGYSPAYLSRMFQKYAKINYKESGRDGSCDWRDCIEPRLSKQQGIFQPVPEAVRNAAESIPEDGHIRKRTVLLILLTA